MFNGLKIKFLRKVFEIFEPNRKGEVVVVDNIPFVCVNDTVGCNDYLLKGTYSYDQVVKLNEMTGFSAGYGYCDKIGPVAFIGIPNPEYAKKSGYFKYDVHEYGKPVNEDEYYFEAFSDEDAKGIGNYTVYGMFDPRVLENSAPVDKVKYYRDYRYLIHNEDYEDFHRGVLSMQIELDGTYSYNDAKIYATGTTKKKTWFSGTDEPIKFALVDESKPIGICGLWNEYDNASFKEVWEYGAEEPKDQRIRFLSDDEAKNYNNYTLYYLCPPRSSKQYNAKKVDRTLDSRFNFIMPDGTDYRLQGNSDIKKSSKKL